ncbi:ATP-binding protein [Roseimaritima sediminicola]|uniref:ATP-binding protein n=1 Tax=Roseimaritima sediminicola TaxID=2662066 RepID=UPI0012982BEE|nr:ATP-binding protein [Roseimaritima sediminicola]
MTRLFLRFYLGVIVILMLAWLILSYVYQQRTASQNIRVIEQALSGGARLAKARLEALPRAQQAAELARMEASFEYPVRVRAFDPERYPARVAQRLREGDVVLRGSSILITARDNEQLIRLGPLPSFVGPSQRELLLGFGAVFLLSAIAIAILLRPVALQLRGVERTASAIAAGDLSARIDASPWSRSLPLAAAFNSMAERTETLLRAQRELLQAVSHELRTPLARIRFATDLIESSPNEQQRQKRLQAVDTATQELDDLVGELLTYVKLESETPTAAWEAIELEELFADLIEAQAVLNPEIQFAKSVSPAPCYVPGERLRLSRAIGNLIRNAARFARQRVTISASQSDSHTLITIEDDGRGVAEADRERIFEPFVRLAKSEGGGSGLGLALVRRIVTSYGGTVGVEPSPHGGARFWIRLPHGERE